MKTMAKQKLVCGVGINDLHEPTKINGKTLKFYATWFRMLNRCYSEECHARQPTYVGCSVCSEWLSLSAFKVWYDIHYRDGLALDKDILVKGNKVYSPEACSFVPGYINSLLTDSGAARGEYPLGVRAMKPNSRGKVNTTYEARCNNGYGKPITKVFKTVAEARQWYITIKKKVANEQAIHAFEAGDINGDVYQALISRQW